MEEKLQEIACRLYKNRVPIDTIAESMDLSFEYVVEWLEAAGINPELGSYYHILQKESYREQLGSHLASVFRLEEKGYEKIAEEDELCFALYDAVALEQGQDRAGVPEWDELLKKTKKYVRMSTENYHIFPLASEILKAEVRAEAYVNIRNQALDLSDERVNVWLQEIIQAIASL